MKIVTTPTAGFYGHPDQKTHTGENRQLHKLSKGQKGKHAPVLMTDKELSLAMERLVNFCQILLQFIILL